MKDPQSSKTLFSQSWYRVADLVPRLRTHARFSRHVYRGSEWYVLQDFSTGRFHRFSPEAYFVIGLMDGKNTMGRIWESACERLGDNMPTQDEVINLLSYLHQADILQSDIPPDTEDMQKRSRREQSNRWLARLKSPAAMNFPLLDPDRFLEKTVHLIRPVLGRAGFALWFLLVAYAAVQAGAHWRELTADITDRVLSMQNVFLLALIYPITRVLHEFSHAYAVKRWGGEVHEMGIMLIAFMPMPYMDASASSAFENKWSRMAVGAAGIIMDVLLAAVALIAWTSIPPGAMRAVAYNVILIGGVSTFFLNGNPLLRFDAYYILSDLLEIPNMADRGNKYIGYLLQRYLLGVQDAVSPAQAEGEESWLALYAVCSFIYRIFISISIVLFIAGRFFIIGVALAIWTGFSVIFFPLYKTLRYVFSNMRRRLARVLATAGVILIALAAAVLLLPLPSFTVTQGVVWAPEESQVFSGMDGFVMRVIARPGAIVSKGEPLIFCEAPELRAELNVLQASVREVEARYRASFVNNRAEAQALVHELERAKAKAARSAERLGEMVVRSPADGVFLLPKAEDLPGSYVRKGMPLGYVTDFNRLIARVVVNQTDVDHIRNHTRRVEARLAESVSTVVAARIEREVPAASRDLPSLALSIEGGGSFALDPKETRNPQAYEKLFQFEISMQGIQARGMGERVFIRFVHDPEPIAYLWYRNIRRVLLKRFDV